MRPFVSGAFPVFNSRVILLTSSVSNARSAANELKNGENNRSAIYSKPVSKKQSKQTKVMFVSNYEFRL